jgi:hypothetical protein
VRGLVLSYYAQIRLLLCERPDLRLCLKRCRHCGILFFTDPRNANREDLFCGFGCRMACHRQRDIRRSVAYYRDHPEKKRRQNRRRYLLAGRTESKNDSKPSVEAVALVVLHVRLIVSLIERRPVSLDEIQRMLAKKARQHRMGGKPEVSYGGRRIAGRGS